MAGGGAISPGCAQRGSSERGSVEVVSECFFAQ